MAQTGYTPILIYSSSTTTNAPVAGNLTNSALGSELAINITDGKLFYKDNANAIQVIGWKTVPATAGGTGQTSYAVGDILYASSTTALSKLTVGATGRWLGSSGTAPQWNAPAALTKTDDTNVTLTLGGSASTALLNAASLTLGWTGTLATTRGGTGLSSFSGNGVVYASSTSALATTSTFSWNGTGLGLGVASAGLLLDVRGGATANVASFGSTDTTAYTPTASNGAKARVYFTGGNATGAAMGMEFSAGGNNESFFGIVQESGGAGAFVWQGYNGSAYLERMRSHSSGGLSIGNTTDPGVGSLSVSGNITTAAAAKGIVGSSAFSVTIANAAAGNILDLSTAMPAGSSGIVNVYGASAGKATILCQRDQGGYYSVTELGTQPRGTYITSITLSGTNLRITNSTGGSETFSGHIVLMI